MNSLKGLRVLVVDDDPDLRECVSEDFQFHELHVQEASGGKEALEMIKNNSFDFIFSDMRMPDGDGRFLATELKKLQEPHPLIFLYSGFNDISSTERVELGIVEIFAKPFESKLMMKKILEHLQALKK